MYPASYEQVEEILNNIFASRLKTVSSKNIGIWTREISYKQYSFDVLKKSEKYIIDNDDVVLTIASVCRIMNDYRRELTPKLPEPKDVYICPFCENSGLAHYILRFDSNGFFVSDNYALKCVCTRSNKNLNIVQFTKGEFNNKTETKNGYFKVFDNYVKWDFYKRQVEKNKNNDVKVDFSSLEFQNYQKSLGIVA